MIEFKGSHFEREVILWGVRWYVAYPISYRQIEEMMEERGVEVDHSTLNRWVVKYAPLLDQQFRARKRPVGSSWRLDETYVKIKGSWKYGSVANCSWRDLGYNRWKRVWRNSTMIEFKGSHFEREVILWGVRWYVAYPISYRQIEEMMEERGVEVDHSTLNRWVVKYAPLLDQQFRARKRPLVPAGDWTRPM